MSQPARHHNSVGGRIREIREQAGLSRHQLAERCGLTVGAVAQVETGRRKPSFETLVSLAKGLEVSLDYLTGLKDRPEATDVVLDQDVQQAAEMMLQLPAPKKLLVREFIEFLYTTKKDL